MAKTKEPKARWPQHKMGKFCGYEEYEDGSIRIADTHVEKMVVANNERHGLNLFVEAINNHLAKQYARVAALEKDFWDGIRDDYGLGDEEWGLTYTHHNRRISRRPKDVEKK
jgi:hypothetical protein